MIYLLMKIRRTAIKVFHLLVHVFGEAGQKRNKISDIIFNFKKIFEYSLQVYILYKFSSSIIK